MKYLNKFKKVIKKLKSDGKYRIFNTILRKRGKFRDGPNPPSFWGRDSCRGAHS